MPKTCCIAFGMWNEVERYTNKTKINQFYSPIDARRVSGEGTTRVLRNMRRVWIASEPFISFNKLIQLYLVGTFAFIRTGIIISRTNNSRPQWEQMRRWFRVLHFAFLWNRLGSPQAAAQVFVLRKKTAMLKPNGKNRNIIFVLRAQRTKWLRQTSITESEIMACVVILSLMPFSHFYSVNMPSGATPTHSLIDKSGPNVCRVLSGLRRQQASAHSSCIFMRSTLFFFCVEMQAARQDTKWIYDVGLLCCAHLALLVQKCISNLKQQNWP